MPKSPSFTKLPVAAQCLHDLLSVHGRDVSGHAHLQSRIHFVTSGPCEECSCHGHAIKPTRSAQTYITNWSIEELSKISKVHDSDQPSTLPSHNVCFREGLIQVRVPLDQASEVPLSCMFHDNVQHVAFGEASMVANDIYMVEVG